MIKPTIGRVMWYRPGNHLALGMTQNDPAQPMTALVAYVHDDNMVTLAIFDHSGRPHHKTNVPIVQEGSPHTAGPSPYCEWMPYQKAVAKGEIAPTLHATEKA